MLEKNVVSHLTARHTFLAVPSIIMFPLWHASSKLAASTRLMEEPLHRELLWTRFETCGSDCSCAFCPRDADERMMVYSNLTPGTGSLKSQLVHCDISCLVLYRITRHDRLHTYSSRRLGSDAASEPTATDTWHTSLNCDSFAEN